MLGYIVIDCSFTTSAFIVNIYNKFFLGTHTTNLGKSIIWECVINLKNIENGFTFSGARKKAQWWLKAAGIKKCIKTGTSFLQPFFTLFKRAFMKNL